MVDRIDHSHPTVGFPQEHLEKPVGKGVEKLTALLTEFQDGLGQLQNLPPAVQGILDLGSQLTAIFGTKDLAEFHHIIPILNKAKASLEPLVHQMRQELEHDETIDFTTGPFASAWTNTLLEKATAELTDLLQLIQ